MKEDVGQLEREVEAARSRVIEDIERLRSHNYLSDAKSRIWSEVDQVRQNVVQNAKARGRAQLDGAVSELKARVAANPGAAIAIGAGLAWRFYRHPPVASVLVGAGLIALWRTDPRHPAPGAELAARAAEMAGSARETIEELAADPVGQVSRLADSAKEQARNLADETREQLGTVAEAARDRLGALTSEARGTIAQAVGKTEDWVDTGRETVAAAMPARGERDQYMLGVAALALAAAVGIAGRRRIAGASEEYRSN
jgi:ElaB/YqjD/DUF883 family membrane-anchored ribosome-binding protein